MNTETNDTSFGNRYFEVQMDTWKFVLLSLGTCLVWYFYWLIRLTVSINKIKKSTVIPLVSVIAVVVCFEMSVYIEYICNYIFLNTDIAQKAMSSILIGIADSYILRWMYIIAIGIAIYISFKSTVVIESLLEENKIYFKMNKVLSVVLPGYYQYYIIRNAENLYQKKLETNFTPSNTPQNTGANTNDKFLRLEKLAKLKESGALTEEEFLKEKTSILSE